LKGDEVFKNNSWGATKQEKGRREK
jgi:hypothetical protein